MSKPENVFRQSVHKYLSSQDVYHEKMSNPYRAGGADDWYSGKGKKSRDLWIEWKFIVVPARDDTMIDLVSGKKPPLTPLQQLWLRERYLEGRDVVVGLGSSIGGVLMTDRTWEQPMSAAKFRAEAVDRQTLARLITQMVKGTVR